MPIKWLQPCFWNQILWPCQLIPGKSSELCETQDRERDEEQPTPPRTSNTGLLRGKDHPPEVLPLLTNAPACTASGLLSRLKHWVVAREDQGREVENYTRTKTQSESDRQVSSWCTRRFPRDSCLRVLRFPRESHAVLGLRVSHINPAAPPPLPWPCPERESPSTKGHGMPRLHNTMAFQIVVDKVQAREQGSAVTNRPTALPSAKSMVKEVSDFLLDCIHRHS